MFSGIVQKIANIVDIQDKKICFKADNKFLTTVQPGDSIATNGVCLTVVEINKECFYADLSNETLQCSTFGDAKIGDSVNLEKSLKLNQGIDGHLVSGHIDNMGVIIDKVADNKSIKFKIDAPSKLTKYIVKKGSVTINGVSLTVNEIHDNIFSVNIIQHTLKSTTLSLLKIGDKINLEVDIIARYIEKLIFYNQKNNAK